MWCRWSDLAIDLFSAGLPALCLHFSLEDKDDFLTNLLYGLLSRRSNAVGTNGTGCPAQAKVELGKWPSPRASRQDRGGVRSLHIRSEQCSGIAAIGSEGPVCSGPQERSKGSTFACLS